jgi:hypothetical protein
MNVEHHLARCLVKTAASLGYTLEPGHDVAWPFTASRHPDLLAEAIDAGAAHAAARYTNGLLTLTVELLRDEATTGDGSDPQWAAAQGARLAVADQRRRATSQRLHAQTSRYRRALERLVAARTGLARRWRGVPAFLPPAGPEVDPPGGPLRQLVTGQVTATTITDPDGTTRLHAATATGTWRVTFGPGTPARVIDAACGAALSG